MGILIAAAKIFVFSVGVPKTFYYFDNYKIKQTFPLMLNAEIDSVSLITNSGKQELLNDIKFSIARGMIYTILGKNGSGKSTLIKSLTGLLPSNLYAVKGKVLFNETNLFNSSDSQLKQIRKNNIRYVFQDVVNSFDPLKKIKYYFDNSGEKEEIIESHLQYFLLPGYKKLSELYPYELSGGMAQRILIVLALLSKPDLIILDEPTSGIDYAITNLVLLKLKEFIKEKNSSVIIVTQDIQFAIKASDYIAYISERTLTKFLPTNEFIGSGINPEIKELLVSYGN
jgi:ABC-type dipeptide/oligopeptide/nickel transport system ATPase component